MSQKNQAANFITESIDDVKVKTSGKGRGQRPESPIYLIEILKETHYVKNHSLRKFKF